MVELISIHIPKTGGTSFYNILHQIYGEQLSVCFKRKDYKNAVEKNPDFSYSLNEKIKVLHGHLNYKEVQSIHYSTNAKIICWLRDPVNRVISNYQHFIKRNSLPNSIKPNQHRINESLLTYAKQEENQNRMSRFLEGLALEDLFFIGFLESFSDDLNRLAGSLNWPEFNEPYLNSLPKKQMGFSNEVISDIKALNVEDYKLYDSAIRLVRDH